MSKKKVKGELSETVKGGQDDEGRDDPGRAAEFSAKEDAGAAAIFRQGWIGLAVWMTFGLFLEGLIAFRTPIYLQDPVRRELFRLGHAHGTLLSLLLIVAGLYSIRAGRTLPRISNISFRSGAILMPIGFILGGISHYESDPNPLVFLAPLGGLLVLFSIISIGVGSMKK